LLILIIEMESSSPDKKPKHTFDHSKLYQILTWKNKPHSALAFLSINVFFYFYVVMGHSLINLSCKTLLIYIAYKVGVKLTRKNSVTDIKDEFDYEVISEEAVKELYIVIYVALNNSV
jgi:hypothetical protein